MKELIRSGWLAAVFAAVFAVSPALAQCPGQSWPRVAPDAVAPFAPEDPNLPSSAPTGWYVQISRDSMVRNTSGNCAWCAVETIARHQGIEKLRGMAQGRGGTYAGEMGRFLSGRGVEFTQTTNRTEGYQLMRDFLSRGQPVLIDIPGHAIVCCGWTRSADGREYIWIVDNTGREGLQAKGWPKEEFDRRFRGWVLGLRPIFPLRPQPNPAPRPGPHVDPSPSLVPQPAPVAPPVPVVDKVAELEKRLAKLEGDLTKKVTDVDAARSTLATKVDALQGAADKAVSLAASAVEQLPKVQGAVEKAMELGLLSKEKGEHLKVIIDQVVAVAPRIADIEAAKVESQNAGRLGLIGGGVGLAGLLFGAFAAFRKSGSVVQAAAGAAANLPQIPGTLIDDFVRILAQRIVSQATQPK